jgi:hypothetical protein
MVRLSDPRRRRMNDSRIEWEGLSRQPKTPEPNTLSEADQPTYRGVRDGHDCVVVRMEVRGTTSTETPCDGLTTETFNHSVAHAVSPRHSLATASCT